MNTYQNLIRKILPGKDLGKQVRQIRRQGLSIVFTNGCFDILHKGHILYLSEASDAANVFIVGLNTDDSVRRLKGYNRPVQDQESRALALSALSFIDYVVLFDEDTPHEIIRVIKPDVLVKGGDYIPEDIVGFDIVSSYGGKVMTLPLVKGYSTSLIIKKLSAGFLNNKH